MDLKATWMDVTTLGMSDSKKSSGRVSQLERRPHSHRRRRIKAAATVRQFSTDSDSHRVKQLHLMDEQPLIHRAV